MDKLRGIVLHSIKYGDTSLIAYVYTDLYGRRAYMLNGVRGGKGRQRASLVQPLFLLDIEAYPERRSGVICRAKEFRASTPLQDISCDVNKNVIALFIGEVLYKLVREEEQNEPLFDFLHRHILLLDELRQGVSNFHLYFLAQLARHLGFFPGNNYAQDLPYFDMQNGIFALFAPGHGEYMDKSTSALLGELLSASYDDLKGIKTNREQRSTLLRMLLDYYCTHLGMANPIRSLAVLEEVFS
jgi:DNA repair protein RecO (recombination protein O)